jgi:hypothetical protein
MLLEPGREDRGIGFASDHEGLVTLDQFCRNKPPRFLKLWAVEVRSRFLTQPVDVVTDALVSVSMIYEEQGNEEEQEEEHT